MLGRGAGGIRTDETSRQFRVLRMSVPLFRPSRCAVVLSSLAGGASGLLAEGGPAKGSQAAVRGLDRPRRPPSARQHQPGAQCPLQAFSGVPAEVQRLPDPRANYGVLSMTAYS